TRRSSDLWVTSIRRQCRHHHPPSALHHTGTQQLLTHGVVRCRLAHCLAYFGQEYKSNLAAFGLFIDLHVLKPTLDPQIGRSIGATDFANQRPDSFDIVAGQAKHKGGKLGSLDHAATNRFAMKPLSEPHAGFDSVTEGVAKIEYGPQAGFALVAGHDVRLEFTRPAYGVNDGGLVQCAQGSNVLLAPGEEYGGDDRPVFNALGQPRRDLARRQGFQVIDIDLDRNRLIKRADHVLAQWVVHARLAADRRIDLGQQGGGYLHEPDSTHIAGRGKSAHVSDDTAPQRDQHSLTVETVFQQGVKYQVERLQVFVFLAVGQFDAQYTVTGGTKRLLDPIRIKPGDCRIGNQCHGSGIRRNALSQMVKAPGLNMNGIRAAWRLNLYGVHHGFSFV